MVNSQFNISQLAQNPNQLGKAEVEWLELQIAKEPWCSAYRILLSKAYFNEDSFLKNKHLRLAAVYAGSREVLFNLIHDPVLAENQEEILVDNPLHAAIDEPLEELIEETDVPVVNEQLEVVEEVEEHDVTPEVVTPSTEELPEIEDRIEEVDSIEEVADEIIEQAPVIDEQVPIEDSAIEEEVVKESTPEESKPSIDFEKVVTYDPIQELKVQPIVPEPEHDPIPFDAVVYNPEVELNKIIEDKKEAEETGEKDFMFWLNHVGEEPKKAKKQKESVKSPSNVQNLLDQFLATKRSKPIQNREFYSAQNRAQQSETDTMSVISETLLKIYEKQGYFEKAMEGYQKLSLQNPSKSAYFAARILELKEKHKQSIK